jgi:ATP-binding cassette subfamily B protein
VDDILAPGDLALLPAVAVAFLLLTLTTGLLNGIDDVISTYVGERFTLAVRGEVLAHLFRQSPDALDRRHLGDLLARVSGDVAGIEGLMVSAPGVLISAIVRALLFGAAMFLIDPLLAVVSLLLAPLFWGAARLFATTARGLARERRRRSGGVMALAEESLAHAPLALASRREAHELARIQAEGEMAARAEVASARLFAAFAPISDLIEVAGALLVTGLGTVALAEGRISLGELLVFLTFLTQLYRPVRDLGSLVTAAYTASGSAERILELLDQAPAVSEAADARDPGRSTGRLVLDDVTYAYGDGPAVLSGVSLALEPGSVTALVGPSGAGKSTLVKLLLRFADPTTGRIMLDGHDLRDLTIEAVRRNIAVQLQDSHILDDSLVENVRYARPGATDAEVRVALQGAAAAGFTDELDAGQRTRLAQHGRRLSGGQRKRIEIARLLVQEAPVVVLDEPTAALDPGTARQVMGSLRELLAGRTVLVITHDRAALDLVDRVVSLDDGRVVVAS